MAKKAAGGAKKKAGALAKRVPALLIRVNGDGRRAIRVLAAEMETSVQALGIEAWNDLLIKYGRKPELKSPLGLD